MTRYKPRFTLERPHVKKLIFAAALALALAPMAAAAADESGAWTVNLAFGDAIKDTLSCTFAVDGSGKLTGPCKDPTGTMQATGTVTATTVEFAYDTTYQGTPVHLDYKGDIQTDGSLKGTIDAGQAQGTFTATKN